MGLNTNQVEVSDEGALQGLARLLDFVGAGVTVTMSGDVATITITSGGGGAPVDAEYLVAALNATLTNERLATDTTNVTWDFSVAGVAKANVGSITESQ